MTFIISFSIAAIISKASMQVTHIVAVVVIVFILIWYFLLLALFQLPSGSTPTHLGPVSSFNLFVHNELDKRPFENAGKSSGEFSFRKQFPVDTLKSVTGGAALSSSVLTPTKKNIHRKFIGQAIEPNRMVPIPVTRALAPMAEIERNMTLYLHTLHKRLSDISGPTVTALKAWDTFMEVTREMPMRWDEENADRFPQQREDGSIFVSLGEFTVVVTWAFSVEC